MTTSPELIVSRDAIARTIERAIKRSGKTREVIAEELSTPDHPVTKSSIDNWTSRDDKKARFPLALLKAFCEATADDSLSLLASRDSLREAFLIGERMIQQRQLKQRAETEADIAAGRRAKSEREKA